MMENMSLSYRLQEISGAFMPWDEPVATSGGRKRSHKSLGRKSKRRVTDEKTHLATPPSRLPYSRQDITPISHVRTTTSSHQINTRSIGFTDDDSATLKEGAPSRRDRVQSSTVSMPSYLNSSAAPSRIPAHKPVRLKQPKHPLASAGTAVYFKYGEEHYPEETVPDTYTYVGKDGASYRYITNFLVYNKRGERLLPIEILDQPRHSALVLYGSLLPAGEANAVSQNRDHLLSRRGRRSSRDNEGDDPSHESAQPFPIRADLTAWCIDYGSYPDSVPNLWLISRQEIYYRLERPAGRYIPTFASAKMKFEIATRIIKTLQCQPNFGYQPLIELLTAATRHEKRKIKQPCPWPLSDEESSLGLIRDDLPLSQHHLSPRRRSSQRMSRKAYASLSTPSGTGVTVILSDGQPGPLTSWGAPFAVEGARESTILGLTDFLMFQMRNFVDSFRFLEDGTRDSAIPNLTETSFMIALRQKASIRRDALQLVESKRRSIESMMNAVDYQQQNGAIMMSSSSGIGNPYVTAQVMDAVPLCASFTPPRNSWAVGAPTHSPLVSIGFPADSAADQHKNILLLRTRRQEERELNSLLRLLKEFSDPEDNPSIGAAVGNDEDDIID